MKTDGYIFTPELLQWRFFHRPVVVQVLIHVLLSSTHNEASSATLSYRDMALQLHTTVKTIRVAIDVLIAEKIITKCSSHGASTKFYINSSHPLSHCIQPWQDMSRAHFTAQYGAQIGAQSRAHFSSPETSDSQGGKVYYQEDKGTVGGTLSGTDGAQSRAQQKGGAQQRAQSRAHFSLSETTLSKGNSEDLPEDKGTLSGTAKGTLARRGKKQNKETLSPTPPNKENKQRKQKKAPTPTQKKEKEKKSETSDSRFTEVLRLFNRLFSGTQVKTISQMTPDRKKMVAKFISDYSYSAIEQMLRQALASDLLMGRKDGGCFISFNWLFNHENYIQVMEGTFDNPSLDASSLASPVASSPQPAQPQLQETFEQRELRLQQERKAKQKAELDEMRKRYLGFIEASKDNPHGSMAKMVREAYQDGTLAKLGIVWNPSVDEENQSLLDLDNKTQDYLKNILQQ